MTAILLIEDDDISRAYLGDAIALLPVRWRACASFGEAGEALRGGRFDLIVSDLNLPDGDLFGALAGFPAGVPVLALSADLDAATRARLLATGAAEAMAKPMPVDGFHAAIRRLCGLDAAPLWNTDKALRALAQNPEAVASLKALFRAEVPSMSAAVRAALDAGDLKAAGDVLHKLKASCGFLGAERLLAECRALESAPGADAWARFERVCAETLAAI